MDDAPSSQHDHGSSVEAATDTFVAPSARLVGAVALGAGANVWYGAVVDGTAASVELAEGANVQDNCRVEATAGHPVRLGPYAAMGHNARVIGATVAGRALIAIGATVLPGAQVGLHCIVAANAVVPEGMVVPPRSLVVGRGRIVRDVSEAEVARIVHTADEYQRLAREYRLGVPRSDEPGTPDIRPGASHP